MRHYFRNLFFALFFLWGTLYAGERPEWPFYVPNDVPLPELKSEGWVRNDIDRFILSKLEQTNLLPAPEASKPTLARRLYFDLIGLPPSPEELKAFLDDASDDAYQKLVDRLLDDPRYGERWARYWLDLARYADTAGYEGDPDLPHAWRYRDYVIDAFNNDKPYDQFIKEQIAGDEFKEVMGAGDLPGAPAENVVALTFLRLAPFTEPRGDETRHEMLSEMTSTVGSVFLGLTVGCAKCHDHKHDDIPTEDFYRMKAFFSTVQIPRPEPGDIYQIGGPIAAKFYRKDEEKWASEKRDALNRQLQAADGQLASLKEKIAKRLGGKIGHGAGFGVQVVNNAGNDYFFAQKKVTEGPQLGIINSDGNQWAIFSNNPSQGPDASPVSNKVESAPLGTLSGSNRGRWFASLENPQHISLGKHTGGKGRPVGAEHLGAFAELLVYDHPLTKSETAAIANYFESRYLFKKKADPQSFKPPKSGLQFWLNAEDAKVTDSGVSEWSDRVSGVKLVQSDKELQPRRAQLGANGLPAIDFENDFLAAGAQGLKFLDNKQGSIVAIYSARHEHEGYGFEVGGDEQFLSTFVNPSADSKDDPIDKLIDQNDARISKGERREIEYLKSRKRFVPQHLKRLKPVAMSLRHSYGPPYEPGVPVSRVMLRGEYDNPGDVVEAGFLSAITGNQDPAEIRLDPFKRWPTRSRRMALAKWIASKDNPMTARVLVNRLWHWHFGQGIVTYTQRLWLSKRRPFTSRVARLAGRKVCRGKVEHQVAASPDCQLGHVPSVVLHLERQSQ